VAIVRCQSLTVSAQAFCFVCCRVLAFVLLFRWLLIVQITSASFVAVVVVGVVLLIHTLLLF